MCRARRAAPRTRARAPRRGRRLFPFLPLTRARARALRPRGSGEVVFSTGMVGYTESLTDPSYRGQLLVSTFPMVGNYGVPGVSLAGGGRAPRLDALGLRHGFESDRIHAAALVVQDYSHHYSHWDALQSLGAWLEQEGVPAISGVDTRALTKLIRSAGALKGRIEVEGEEPLPFSDPNDRNLVAEVSTNATTVYNAGGDVKVLAVDCGMKHAIVRQLVARGAEVTVVPWDHAFAAELGGFDGLFLSNGPGDPTRCEATIAQLREALAHDAPKPIFGICLGNQLLGLAAGAQTLKLPFGNRGQNQPVMNKLTSEAFITPQNHGYAIDDATLPAGWQPLFENINDGSNEGLVHESKPFFTAQFHPEAAGGPTDTAFLFDVFLDRCRRGRDGEPADAGLVFPTRARSRRARPQEGAAARLGRALDRPGGRVRLLGLAGDQGAQGGGAAGRAHEPQHRERADQRRRREQRRPARGQRVLPARDARLCRAGHQAREARLDRHLDGRPDGAQLRHRAARHRHLRQVRREGARHDDRDDPHTEDRQIFNDKLNEIDEKIAVQGGHDHRGRAVAASSKEIGYPA